MNIKTITRTAAVMYADTMSNRTTNTIRRKFVEAAYVSNGNHFMTIAEVANVIEEKLGLLFSEDEIRSIVKDSNFFTEVLNASSEDIKYNLPEKRYSTLASKPIDEMEEIINDYFRICKDKVSLDINNFKELIYRYMHAIMNTNISLYSHFVNPTKYKDVPKISSEQFLDDEIDIINDFVKWDNEKKNKAIFKLVNYCIEYAIVINHSSEDVLSKSLRTKVFYLDNSILYRAIGINGETRKKRTLSFLRKCKESGQRFVISKYTRQEFFDTVDYHLRQLNSSTPFGCITPKVFKRYSNGDGFYQFYHGWRNKRLNYGFDIFKNYIHTLYKNLVREFDIDEDFNVPFNEKDEPITVNNYKNEIQTVKRTYRNEPHLMDARNMYWIECKRDRNNVDVASTKYYFITSDQKLQIWDKGHSVDQPLTLLPSQWMGLILKYVSRSSDDYKSFISFMNLSKDTSVISEDELQSIMAGISEMTEDFSKQESIIESMIEIKFGDILKGNIRENAKKFTKDKLEEDLERKLAEKENEKAKLVSNHEALMEKIKKEALDILEKTEKKHREEKRVRIAREIDSLKRRYATIEYKVDNREALLKTIIYGGEILFTIGWIILILKVGWDKMEMWTYIVGLPAIILTRLYIAIKGKAFKTGSFINVMCEKYRVSLCEKFDFSQSELEELEKMKLELEK